MVGAGFAGAATARALGRAGLGPGVIVEQEASWGVHSSGRNAALVRLAESDPLIADLAWRSLAEFRRLDQAGTPLLHPTGGLTLAGAAGRHQLASTLTSFARRGIPGALLPHAQALDAFPFLASLEFDAALLCQADAVVDIHALLGLYVAQARDAGFVLQTDCRAEELIVEAGRVTGVHTRAGDIRADVVIDASGAWAGRLGRAASPLPLTPLRRHLFVSAPTTVMPREAPYVWFEDAALYFRPESGGLLMCPCDETPDTPGLPSTDPAAAELLADKLTRHAPGLADLAIRRSWACLRTFAPDRRPIIGADPTLAGLFHVSGLGGFGMMTSAAVGELAATLLADRTPDWVDAAVVSPARR